MVMPILMRISGVESERRAYRIGTGSGYIWRRQYIPVVVTNSNAHESLQMCII